MDETYNNESSPENCVFEEAKVAKTPSGSADSSSSVNSEDQRFPFNNDTKNYFELSAGDEVYNSLLDFRAGGNNGSLLSFDPYAKNNGGYSALLGNDMSYNGYGFWNNVHVNNNPRVGEDVINNCYHGGWNMYSAAESTEPVTGLKRSQTGESVQLMKKQCSGVDSGVTTNSSASKRNKPKTSSPKEPQSLAAKNRRERISERLKTLQELVPNGTKVDLVTMLEKAISYVKFLQLQVKVLATDEFWPVPGGRAPDISQVKDAIDAILTSSQNNRISSN